MKILIVLVMILFSSFTKVLADEMKDKSGLPLILSVDEILNKNQSDLVGWTTSVKGFLFYEEKDEVAYLFKDISDVVAFENENSVLVVVPSLMQSIFKKRHLCHVILRGVFNKNGLSATNVVLQDITHLTLSEVFAYNLSEKDQMDDYKCFLQKVVQ